VEDSAIGVRSAKAAGLFTVATPSIWTQTQDFSAADLLLGSLGDPDQPLTTHDEARLGAKFLSLERLAALHAAAAPGVVHAEAH
jgi:beta-phosphoglucomutase-like phosphatase (HAD superfamily)